MCIRLFGLWEAMGIGIAIGLLVIPPLTRRPFRYSMHFLIEVGGKMVDATVAQYYDVRNDHWTWKPNLVQRYRFGNPRFNNYSGSSHSTSSCWVRHICRAWVTCIGTFRH